MNFKKWEDASTHPHIVVGPSLPMISIVHNGHMYGSGQWFDDFQC